MSNAESSQTLCQCPTCGRMHRHLGTPPASVMEQIARDMRDGIFPRKSEQTEREEAEALLPGPAATPSIPLDDFPLYWRGRANALRAVYATMSPGLGDGMLATAETYETCANELVAAMEARRV